jgi:hypothetical protein
MVFSITLDVLVAVYILSRQRRIRPVPRALSLRFPVIVGVIGLIDLLSYTDTHHHITQTDYLWVGSTLVVGALLLGAIRAFTVKLWVTNNWVVRQGTWVTIGLWVLSLALHFLGGVGAQHAGAGNLEAASFLLYIAVTYGVQNYVVYRRAVPLWSSLGPDAGHRLQVNFGQGPGGVNTIFGTFRGGPGFGPGGPGFCQTAPGPSGGAGFGRTRQEEATIIDAEVVDDDEGPPELR